MSKLKIKKIAGRMLGLSAVGILAFAAIYSKTCSEKEPADASEKTTETTRPIPKDDNAPAPQTRKPRSRKELPQNPWEEQQIVLHHQHDSEEDEFYFQNGDLYKRYGETDSKTRRDNRVWVDAKIPFELSSKITLYGVSTLALGDLDAKTLDDYTRNYGVGGGIGISYKISDSVNLNFDVRHTQTVKRSDDSHDPNTEAAGFSLELKF